MRWLLTALLVALPTTALAEYEAPIWRCERSATVVPLRGSTSVPSNARIWIAGKAPWSYSLYDGDTTLPIEPTLYHAEHAPVIELRPELVAWKNYTLRNAGGEVETSFFVTDVIDRTPPALPVFPDLRFAPERGGELILQASVDDDTAMLRVEFRDRDKRTQSRSFLTTAHSLALQPAGCSLGYQLQPGSAICVRLTALDLAGNESASIERCTSRDATIAVALQTPPAQRDSPRALFAIAFIVALLVGVFVVFAPEIDMGWLRRRITGDTLLPAAAKQLARTVHRTAVVRAGLAIGGAGIGIATTGAPIAWFVGLAAVLLVARQLWVFARAGRMLQLLEDGAIATLHGDHVLRVATSGKASWLVCSQRQLALATERVLPLARVLDARPR